MEYRRFGKTGWNVAVNGFGTWQFSSTWSGSTDEGNIDAMKAFLDAGGNFIDTADVYGAGHSESLVKQAIEEWRKSRRAGGADDADRRIYVVTKSGRAHGDAANPLSSAPHGDQNYQEDALRAAVAASSRRLGVETLDLVLMHCPPTETLRKGALFDILRTLVKEGKIAHWGVSVETVDEALLCSAQPDCAAIEIIFNCLRLKPAEDFFPLARTADVGIIVRVPLASGLLTGKINAEYLASLAQTDHRTFNKSGDFFDKGETWSGLGEHLENAAFPAVEAIRALVPEGTTMAAFALRWILMFPDVSVVIPGMRTREHVAGNLVAAALPSLSDEAMDGVRQAYDKHVREIVHGSW
jgi:aryl-alcohol dehydrogenase-like predicted oxidoreductase